MSEEERKRRRRSSEGPKTKSRNFGGIASGTLLTETFNFLPATARVTVPGAGFVSQRSTINEGIK